MGITVDQDREHLKILSIVYYILSGLSALGSLCGFLFIGLGAFISQVNFPETKGNMPPGFAPNDLGSTIGSIYIIVGIAIFIVALCTALLEFLTARWLGKMKNRTFCTVVAALHLLSIPLGTILGIFSIIVLSRESVKEIFDNSPNCPDAPNELE